MGIGSLIKREKSRFFSAKYNRDRTKIMKETEALESARAREAELAKLNAAKQRVSRDLGKIKMYNQKVQGPSKAQRFATGLATAINKGREQLAKQQQKSRGLDFGPSNGGPFGLGSSGSSPFAPSKPVKQKSKPKKKITKTEYYE